MRTGPCKLRFELPVALAAALCALLVCAGLAAPTVATAAPALVGQVTSSSEGQGVPDAGVEIWRQVAGDWQLENVVDVDWSGNWSYDTTDTTPVRVYAYDFSTGHTPAWFGGTSLLTASDVIPDEADPPTVDMTLQMTRGATLGGRLRDADDGTPLAGIKVEAQLEGVTGAVLHTATSAADGSYRFTGLGPGSYLVKFSDSTLRYDEQWWPGAPDVDSAITVDVDGPGAFHADDWLIRHETVTELSPAAPIPGDSTFIALGGAVTLETVCTDDNLGGAPRDGMHVVVQSSPDNTAWSPTGIAVAGAGSGRYRATIVGSALGPTYYRFVIADGDHLTGAASDSALVKVHGQTYWGDAPASDAAYAATSAPDPPGEFTQLTCTLLSAAGAPAPGRGVRLEASLDGQSYWDSEVPVVDHGNGAYTARFCPLQSQYYRFVTVGTKAEPAVPSERMNLWPWYGSGGWVDFGGGPKGYLNSYGPVGLSTTVWGISALPTSSVGPIYLQASRDGRNFWPASGYSVLPRSGSRYSVGLKIGAKKYYYRVAAAPGGNQSWSAPYMAVGLVPEPAVLSPTAKVRGRTVTVTGQIRPHLQPGVKVVTVVVKRRGSSSKVYWTTTRDSGSWSSYKLTMKLRPGRYTISTSIRRRYGILPDTGYPAMPEFGESQKPAIKSVTVR